ncbi:hypothetical protein KC331_g28 [Hortaea werneckii]|nr:hypothetical protein KC331_g28 [Hortaea werneckii]
MTEHSFVCGCPLIPFPVLQQPRTPDVRPLKRQKFNLRIIKPHPPRQSNGITTRTTFDHHALPVVSPVRHLPTARSAMDHNKLQQYLLRVTTWRTQNYVLRDARPCPSPHPILPSSRPSHHTGGPAEGRKTAQQPEAQSQRTIEKRGIVGQKTGFKLYYKLLILLDRFSSFTSSAYYEGREDVDSKLRNRTYSKLYSTFVTLVDLLKGLKKVEGILNYVLVFIAKASASKAVELI